jgi:hypothetical protein
MDITAPILAIQLSRFLRRGRKPVGHVPVWLPSARCSVACGLLPFVALLALALPRPALALEPVTVRSQSGQFMVRGLPRGAPLSGYATSAVDYVRLDPTITTIALERIRQAVLDELGLPNQWRGLVTVHLQSLAGDFAPVRINSVRYTDGWGYQVEMPERIDKERFIRVAVQVVLLEVANRTSKTREAELPPWLAVGLAAELQVTSLSSFALEPETQVARRAAHPDVMQGARELLQQRPALKFDELCLPAGEENSRDEAAFYRACAHLFVHELLRLRTGRDCLRDLLQRLPENLNWQTTFLQAFRGHFPRLVDADKWYALTIATFVGRDAMSVWPVETSWKQLEEILTTQVQVRLDASELPLDTQVTLQRIIAEWEFPRQQPVLQQKIHRLQALRQRAAPEVNELVEDYLRILTAYSGGRQSARPAGLFRSRINSRTVVKQLDELDARRVALRGPASKSDGSR